MGTNHWQFHRIEPWPIKLDQFPFLGFANTAGTDGIVQISDFYMYKRILIMIFSIRSFIDILDYQVYYLISSATEVVCRFEIRNSGHIHILLLPQHFEV